VEVAAPWLVIVIGVRKPAPVWGVVIARARDVIVIGVRILGGHGGRSVLEIAAGKRYTSQ
jgi:phosphatidylglycerophosphate synthase